MTTPNKKIDNEGVNVSEKLPGFYDDKMIDVLVSHDDYLTALSLAFREASHLKRDEAVKLFGQNTYKIEAGIRSAYDYKEAGMTEEQAAKMMFDDAVWSQTQADKDLEEVKMRYDFAVKYS